MIIGGGDTAADCLGNAHREGCASVEVLSVYPEPPRTRPAGNPWPEWPLVLQTYPAHEEGGRRHFGVMVTGFHGTDARRGHRDRGLRGAPRGRRPRVQRSAGDGADDARRPGPARHRLRRGGLPALVEELGGHLTESGAIDVDQDFRAAPGVFAGGDATRGASLIVWAIAEARRAAAACDRFLAASR